MYFYILNLVLFIIICIIKNRSMTSYSVLWLSEEILMHNETEVSTDLFFLCTSMFNRLSKKVIESEFVGGVKMH